jgi:hypothetical protein
MSFEVPSSFGGLGSIYSYSEVPLPSSTRLQVVVEKSLEVLRVSYYY